MNKIKQLWRVATHPRELRLTLSGLGMRLGGDDALGGLTAEERSALAAWTNDSGVKAVVEIGTLFGLTAKELSRKTQARIVAVDLFCWNPFGLTADQHERFTRDILSGSGVELVRDDARRFLSSLDEHGLSPESTLVFLDGDHRYEAVKAELEILRQRGVRHLAGHDFGNPLFGVTKAVREIVGEPDAVAGMCWYKRV